MSKLVDKMMNRDFHKNPLKVIELDYLTRRVDHICEIVEITNADDILDNLDTELGNIIYVLNKSIKAQKIHESGLRVVK